ncbi:polysaccharide biosynthesis/export family protein [Tuwongella immobilis]|uniref:Uncharacterized protein n=1 Tax=Tuwongella immobilis TaxID=692036 RepID=A0A6C2YID4_9BACT|nr:polysaccharide biosynthesis/export family protein [Tuwongella immobilis]VIP01298.1 polysaccharide export protein : Polysaccharide export protein OS=Rhodopirellula maiorica SM1 GN=RMSM_06388 PE=4 SV=1: Poly_export: SLBB [Tuwongella immobilis]VTR98022.1 polysaccharide export protein : Polysaccharide export protein OS=Rhodopirellula maiorica SM1 GN=RMSM_06388 PE=4 SV=1: Poly_export: SLBB [Tuwongella immobilis]
MRNSVVDPRMRRCSIALGMIVSMLAGCSMGGRDLSPDNNRQYEPVEKLRDKAPIQAPRELELTTHSTYVVEPGDALLIQPVDLESPVRLPNDQIVQPDGSIDLGKYGRLFVAGRPITEIELAIQQAVRMSEKNATKIDPGFIDVRIVSRVSKVYYVLGEVNTPGSFPIVGRETVLDALLVAGGVTDRASLENISLSRPTRPGMPRTVLPVLYPAIVQLGDTATNYQVQPGDRIFVPSKRFAEGWLGKKKHPAGSEPVPCPDPPNGSHKAKPDRSAESDDPLRSPVEFEPITEDAERGISLPKPANPPSANSASRMIPRGVSHEALPPPAAPVPHTEQPTVPPPQAAPPPRQPRPPLATLGKPKPAPESIGDSDWKP